MYIFAGNLVINSKVVGTHRGDLYRDCTPIISCLSKLGW
jgi:hypothetical protein